MAASKKLSVVAALVLMTLLSTGVANAQVPPADLGVITCQSVAVPPIVRAEGIAELVGDIVISCTNVEPASGGSPVSHLITNVSVSLNVNVTNNLHPDPLTDAVLVINENNTSAFRARSLGPWRQLPELSGTVFTSPFLAAQPNPTQQQEIAP